MDNGTDNRARCGISVEHVDFSAAWPQHPILAAAPLEWGSGDPEVVIDKEARTATFEPSFALAIFLGRHVIPGAHYLPARIVTGDAGIGPLLYPATRGLDFMQTELEKGAQVAAFRKPDGNAVVYLMNQGPAARARIRFGHETATAVLPGNALCAVILKQLHNLATPGVKPSSRHIIR